MRMYQPIWEQIKRDSTAQVRCAPQLQKRLIKAITVEKCKDLGYKLLKAETDKKARLGYICKDDIVTFTLTDRHVYSLKV